MKHPDTIFALATAQGRAGVAVIRIAGPGAILALNHAGHQSATPRKAKRALFKDAAGTPLDDGLVLWFPGPRSFTGDDVCEWHLHGSAATVDAALTFLATLPSFREAQPGEFTRRAFENGKLDLAQVEGLADLIEAETSAQRRAALRAMDGALGKACMGWGNQLKTALAHLEASIDFADEELPDNLASQLGQRARTLRTEIRNAMSSAETSERLRRGYRVALLGAPNAGKSTLLNALAKRDVAITSSHAGTTRDMIEVALDLRGWPVTIVDTAGLRETDDDIEAQGVARARRAASEADLRLYLLAPDAPLPPDVTVGEIDLVFHNKIDMALTRADVSALQGSALTGDGLDALVSAVIEALSLSQALPDTGLVTRRRQKDALVECIDALDRLIILADDGTRLIEYPELAAEEARLAMAALGRVTGHVGVEDLLDVIFSDFCLGK